MATVLRMLSKFEEREVEEDEKKIQHISQLQEQNSKSEALIKRGGIISGKSTIDTPASSERTASSEDTSSTKVKAKSTEAPQRSSNVGRERPGTAYVPTPDPTPDSTPSPTPEPKAGPKRSTSSRSGRARPGTAYALAPVTAFQQPTAAYDLEKSREEQEKLDEARIQEQAETGEEVSFEEAAEDEEEEEEEEEEAPVEQPTPASPKAKPKGKPFGKRPPRAKMKGKPHAKGKFRPKGKAKGKPSVKQQREEALRQSELKDAEAAGKFTVDVHSLLEYETADSLMSGRVVSEIASCLSNLNTLKQLSLLIATPEKSTLLSNAPKSSGHYDEIEKKLVFIATQILHTANTRACHDMIFRHRLVGLLFTILDTEEPLHGLRAGYFRQIITNLLRYRRVDVIRFLMAKGPNGKSEIMKLFNHVDNDDVVFLIIELLDREPPPQRPQDATGRAKPKPQAPALYWSKTFGVVPTLLDRMQIKQSGNSVKDLRVERQAENAGLLLGLIIQRSATHPHLIRAMFEHLDRVIDLTLGRASYKFHNITFDTGMKVLSTLLACISRNWVEDTSSSAKGKLLSEIASKLIKTLPLFVDTFKNPPSSIYHIKPLSVFKDIPNPKPVGVVRLNLVEYFAEFTKSAFVHLYEDNIVDSGFLKACVDLFMTCTHNNFLHDSLSQQLFAPIITGESEKLMKHLLFEAGLLTSLMKNYRTVDDVRGERAETYTSYNGYLTILANLIQRTHPDVISQHSSSLGTQWSSFRTAKLDKQNTIERQVDE